MKLFTKVKAGALQFVLFIGAVIAVLLLTFVLLAHTHLFFARKTNKFVEVITQNDFVLDNAMSTAGTVGLKNLEVATSKDDIEASIKKSSWGLFEKHETTTSFEKYNFKTIALTGSALAEQAPALFLKDNQRPLIMVGNSKVTGTAFLPEQGVRPGNISGESYFGTRLVYGQIKHSKTMLPKIDAKILEEINVLCNQQAPRNQKVIVLSGNKDVKNSFSEPIQVIIGENIDLSGIKLTGNIVVRASQGIRVDASTLLTDVILTAPNISIGDNVIGTFQAFASNQITVGKNTLLEYPTALVVMGKNSLNHINANSFKPPAIQIKSGSTVKGVLMYRDTSVERYFYPKIKIEERATLIGQLYCEKSLELKGDVIGNVFTDSFMALENGSIYQNHLYKGTINAVALKKQFVGINLNEAASSKKVVKWLY